MSILEALLSSNSKIAAASGIEYARVYVRVSHERSAEKNISPETQRQRIEAYAREKGYRIIEWYSDLGISAFKNDSLRVSWNKMIEDAKADPLTTVLIVWRYDRFSRGDDAQVIQRNLLKHGVRIESAEEGYYDPDSETGAIMMPLTWSLNRLFSIKLRNVVIPNMKTNFVTRDPESGWAYKNGGWSMFGYKKHRIKTGRSAKHMDIHKAIWLLDDQIVADQPMHQWARTMLIEWRLNESLGYDSIAARLTAAGIPTPSGKAAWSPSTVQSLIGNWDRLFQYTGIAFWNREDCTDRNNRTQRDTSEWIVVENAHPSIITLDEAEGIWAMVSDRKRTKTSGGGKVSRWALSGGLLKCAHCGANYAGTSKGRNDYYLCGSHLYRRGAGCGQPAWYIPRDDIEDLIISKILKPLSIPDADLQGWLDEANDALQRDWQNYADTARERAEAVADLVDQQKNLYDLVAYNGLTEALREKIDETTAAMARLKALDGVEQPSPLTLESLILLRNDCQSALDANAHDIRQKLFKTFEVIISADAQTKTLSGRLNDPRALLARYMAVPRGVEPLSRP